MNTSEKRKITSLTLAAFTVAFSFLLIITGCSKNDNPISSKSKTFVLVHGAFQGPYAFQFLRNQLEAAGQKVVVVELPGHGSDQTPPAKITLNTYRDKVIAAIKATNGQVVLVGHSAGGSVITAVADTIPEQIEKLVYIAGAIPANGQSLGDIAMMDPNSQLFSAIVPSADGTTGSIPGDKLYSIFCQDGSEEVRQLLIANNRPEPTGPQIEKIKLKNSPATMAVPKYYIRTTEDHAATIEIQNKVIAAAGIKNVFTLNSSHCPFLSMPDKVTAILLQIAR